MKKIKNILKQINLSDTEINIYLEGLNYFKIGVKELEKETNIKRTTIYHALHTLSKKGLVAKRGTGSRTEWTMTSPDNIKRLINKEIDLLKNYEEEIDEIIPLLSQKNESHLAKTEVLQFEGIEGVKLVVEEALYCKSRKWDIIAPPNNFFSEFDKEYAKYFIETRKKREIITRSLWEETGIKRPLTHIEILQRQPRFLPEVMKGKFKSVIIIFDDKVAIISSLKVLAAILIVSQEICDTHKALFDGLWSNAKKLN